MKNIIIILLLFLSTSNLFAWDRIKGTQGGADSSTVGKWDFNAGIGSTAYDVSGNGLNGTIAGAAWADGLWGTCLEWDGTGGDYVDAKPISLYRNMTISVWIKPIKANTNEYIMMLEGTGGGIMRIYTNGEAIWCHIVTDTGGAAFGSPNNSVSYGVWNYWVLTVNAYTGVAIQYKNGEEIVASQNGNWVGILNTGTDLWFGTYDKSASAHAFKGLIEGVHISSRTYSAAEVFNNYAAQSEARQ